MKGAAWTVGLNLAGRMASLVGTVVLARYLAPETIGEVQVAAVLVATVNYFSLFGLAHYVAAKPHEDGGGVFHATVFCLVLGFVALGALVLFGDELAPFFDAPAAAQYLPGLTLAMVLDRLSVIPSRVLVRDMRFRTNSLIRGASEAVFPVIAVWLAIEGHGGEALVAANIARSLVRTVATFMVVRARDWLLPRRLTLAKTRQIFAFSLPNGVATMAGYAARNWDGLLISRLFGPAELGYYQYAHHLSGLPAEQIGEHVGDVLVPSFARIPARRRLAALAHAVRLLGMIMFPMAFGLGVAAPTIVATFLSPAWEPVAPRMAVLAALSAVQPLGYVVHSYLNAVDRPRWVMVLGIFRTMALLALLQLLGIVGGPLWACLGVGVAFGLYSLSSLLVVARIEHASPGILLKPLGPPLLACLPLVAAVLAVRHLMGSFGVEAGPLRLTVEVLAGAAAFVGAALVVAPAVSRELVDVARTTLGRRRMSEAPPSTAAGAPVAGEPGDQT